MFDADARERPAVETTEQRYPAFSQIGSTLYLAGASYLRKGGSLSELRRIFERLIAESSLNDDAGAHGQLRESAARSLPAASSPLANGKGLLVRAPERLMSIAPPAREPSAAQRRTAGAIAKEVAATIFDTFKLRDGRAIGDVRYGELARLELSGLVEAEVVRAIRKRGVAPHDSQVRHIIKPAVLDRIVAKAKEKHHVAQ